MYSHTICTHRLAVRLTAGDAIRARAKLLRPTSETTNVLAVGCKVAPAGGGDSTIAHACAAVCDNPAALLSHVYSVEPATLAVIVTTPADRMRRDLGLHLDQPSSRSLIPGWNQIRTQQHSGVDLLEQAGELISKGFGIAPHFLEFVTLCRRPSLLPLGLTSWVKPTGGLGLHVVVPIKPARDVAERLEFARDVSEAIACTEPQLYTTTFARLARERWRHRHRDRGQGRRLGSHV
jgi:hypothetical protein